MLVNYCDLCNIPLKENDYFRLYISNSKETKFDNITDYYKYLDKVQKEVKEICPTCKYIIDKIFEYRAEELYKLTEDCKHLFGLPTILNPKERKNEKNEKK